MNLKNNYSLKKLLKWTNKKCKNFIINIVYIFFFKKRKIHGENTSSNCVSRCLYSQYNGLEDFLEDLINLDNKIVSV